jgi:4-diphosphocytidyl-2C-methyl-D-erythritol kinase
MYEYFIVEVAPLFINQIIATILFSAYFLIPVRYIQSGCKERYRLEIKKHIPLSAGIP